MFAHAAIADVANLGALKDNTLIQDSAGAFSNGIGPSFFSGRIGAPVNSIRRGLIAFDVSGSIPAGSIIDSVTLTLFMSQTNAGAHTINLHPVLADWGEGTSFAPGGGGAPSTAGDATWKHTFYPNSFWSSDGGDYSGTVSGSQVVNQIGYYTFGSTATMVADAQGWLDMPAGNFGWILVGNEASPTTVKRFDTRENFMPERRPVLSVDYTPAPNVCSTCVGDMSVDGSVTGADIQRFIDCMTGQTVVNCTCADMDANHSYDPAADVPLFVDRLLAAPPCD
ncbi:MAG: DNRLRE domain-containing protein [Planctomycetota bacterium]|nr:DNRLRE domain-containing protein [Planctomycetota bacterium]